MIARPRLSVSCCAVVLCALLGLPFARAQQQHPPTPLTENAILGLLKNGVSSRRIAALARQRGVDFKLTPEVENQLRQSGADIFILETLRELSPIPVGSPAGPAHTAPADTGSPSAAGSRQDSKASPTETHAVPSSVASGGAANSAPTHAPPATAYEEPSDTVKGTSDHQAASQIGQSAEAHASLGLAAARKGDWASAVTEDREAIRLDPNRAAAHAQLGSALAQQAAWDEAIAEDREAIRLDPNSPLGHLSLGEALTQKNDWAGAVAELQEAIRLDPNNADAHFNLALALIHQKDWDDAVTEARAVISLRPEDAVAHCKLGLAYRRTGDYVKAGAEEREAIRLKPDLAEAHFILGVVLEWQGDLAGALAECQKATELDPSDPIYRKTAERLYEDVHRH
ncbi:MAG TPA: tetratricopeptide repeat protein [Terriglobia bacterium]|nr:tetratricopeptide repeat protein [Terriglobia bacterium]